MEDTIDTQLVQAVSSDGLVKLNDFDQIRAQICL